MLSFIVTIAVACSDDSPTPEEPGDIDAAPAIEDAAISPDAPTVEPLNCAIPTSIPHDVPADADQSVFDDFSWQTFLAVNAPAGGQADDPTPPWTTWSSTADYLNLVSAWYATGGTRDTFPAFGAVYYPQACLDYCSTEGINCSDYRTIEQVGKINDAIFEADNTGLSSNPVIAANGSFVRYEIRMNQDMYDLVSSESRPLYDVDDLVTGDVNGTCGNAGGSEGVINVKLAWMDMSGFDASTFYTEPRLIFTAAGSNSTGQDSCSLETMGLVGMHIAHKTESQQTWVWSTFEHNRNAPDCGAFALDANSVNTACPSTDASGWNFYPSDCQSDGDPGKCQSCNTVPADNEGDESCSNKYCTDRPPADENGYSRLCRQVPVTEDGPYSDAYRWNQACQRALGTSVWANYMLISTQWFEWNADGAPTQPTSCSDVAGTLHSIPQDADAKTARGFMRPQVADTGNAGDRPFLANTSMESYERSNCMGCHGKGALTNSNYTDGAGELPPQGNNNGVPNTASSDYYFSDFSWWLALQVPADGISDGN